MYTSSILKQGKYMFSNENVSFVFCPVKIHETDDDNKFNTYRSAGFISNIEFLAEKITAIEDHEYVAININELCSLRLNVLFNDRFSGTASVMIDQLRGCLLKSDKYINKKCIDKHKNLILFDYDHNFIQKQHYFISIPVSNSYTTIKHLP